MQIKCQMKLIISKSVSGRSQGLAMSGHSPLAAGVTLFAAPSVTERFRVLIVAQP